MITFLKSFSVLVLMSHIATCSFGQKILPNNCDSAILTMDALRKCKLDSVWLMDISIKVNYITSLKTQLLPRYRPVRKSISMPEAVLQHVRELKKAYDSVLSVKTDQYEKDMDKNQLYVQPKAYISSFLSFQLFKFYPDVYAILLNEIHLDLRPTTSRQEFERYKRMFDKLIQSIPRALDEKLSEITGQMWKDESRLPQQGAIWPLQGMIAEDYKKKCNIVNFLMWTE